MTKKKIEEIEDVYNLFYKLYQKLKDDTFADYCLGQCVGMIHVLHQFGYVLEENGKIVEDTDGEHIEYKTFKVRKN